MDVGKQPTASKPAVYYSACRAAARIQETAITYQKASTAIKKRRLPALASSGAVKSTPAASNVLPATLR